MKDIICPKCNTRNVPFWPVFWGIRWWKVVRCRLCNTRVKHSFWKSLIADTAHTVIGIFLAFIIIGISSILHDTGLPLFITIIFGVGMIAAMMFGLGWSQTRLLALKPVKEKNKDQTP